MYLIMTHDDDVYPGNHSDDDQADESHPSLHPTNHPANTDSSRHSITNNHNSDTAFYSKSLLHNLHNFASLFGFDYRTKSVDTYGDTVTIKRPRDGADDDQEPSAGTDRGQSALVEETTDVFEAPAHQEFETGVHDEQAEEEVHHLPDWSNILSDERNAKSLTELEYFVRSLPKPQQRNWTGFNPKAANIIRAMTEKIKDKEGSSGSLERFVGWKTITGDGLTANTTDHMIIICCLLLKGSILNGFEGYWNQTGRMTSHICHSALLLTIFNARYLKYGVGCGSCFRCLTKSIAHAHTLTTNIKITWESSSTCLRLLYSDTVAFDDLRDVLSAIFGLSELKIPSEDPYEEAAPTVVGAGPQRSPERFCCFAVCETTGPTMAHRVDYSLVEHYGGTRKDRAAMRVDESIRGIQLQIRGLRCITRGGCVRLQDDFVFQHHHAYPAWRLEHALTTLVDNW
ncbi:hypothetical protein Tco_0747928 [Tanacetum coccineum]|uniref:PiggyBac transposable element-derived protein domain-containing protein n=1 Tax=Tanacetum coccineum TaxID=301880 RepID=A0ABQ4YX16_9ASTR